MKYGLLFVLAALRMNPAWGQTGVRITDTTRSVYPQLETRKYYRVSTGVHIVNGDTIAFKVNGRTVDRTTHDKYRDSWAGIAGCRPCVLMTYDADDRLLREAVQYTDCPVGYAIEYYPGGTVKSIGHYKENESGIWDMPADTYCIRDGTFTYFSASGEQLYSEVWKDGRFLRQIPEQPKAEIWRFEVSFKGVAVEQQVLTPAGVREIALVPRYKNHLESHNIKVRFRIETPGHKPAEHICFLRDFRTIEVERLLDEAGIAPGGKAGCRLDIFMNGKWYATHYLTILR